MQTKPKHKPQLNKFLPSEEVEHIFAFISNELIRTNLLLTFRYLFVLILVEEEYQLDSNTQSLIFKDIIIHISSIVECVLGYTLQNVAQLDKKLGSKINSIE